MNLTCSDLQAVLLALAGHQVPLGDGQFLLLDVSRQVDDLHAVLQGRRHGVQQVARGDEQDLREVERHVQVVVGEGVVLLGVQHLQQGAGGVAVPVVAEFVDLVEHEDGVVDARPCGVPG